MGYVNGNRKKHTVPTVFPGDVGCLSVSVGKVLCFILTQFEHTQKGIICIHNSLLSKLSNKRPQTMPVETTIVDKPEPKAKSTTAPASLRLQATPYDIECGVDEVARGCLFGRVYAGAVIWKLPNTDGSPLVYPILPKGIVIRDSKKMSRIQRERADTWIRKHAVAVGIAHRDEQYIDTYNIRQAAHDAMADAIRTVHTDVPNLSHVLIDGDGFAPRDVQTRIAPAIPMFRTPTHVAMAVNMNPTTPTICTDDRVPTSTQLPAHTCVVKGDATYFSIACAAIVAKVAHDKYIRDLCSEYPDLDEKYQLCKNVGYGTKSHRDGLRVHGASPFHRKSFGGVCS